MTFDTWFDLNSEWILDLFSYRAVTSDLPVEARGSVVVTVECEGKKEDCTPQEIANTLARRVMETVCEAFKKVEKRLPTMSDNIKIYANTRDYTRSGGQAMTVYYKW